MWVLCLYFGLTPAVKNKNKINKCALITNLILLSSLRLHWNMTLSVLFYTPLWCLLWEKSATSRPEARRKERLLRCSSLWSLMGVYWKKLNSSYSHSSQSNVTKRWPLAVSYCWNRFFFKERFQINFVSIPIKNTFWPKVSEKKRSYLQETTTLNMIPISIEEFSRIIMNFCTFFA